MHEICYAYMFINHKAKQKASQRFMEFSSTYLNLKG